MRKPLYRYIYMYMGYIRPIQVFQTYIWMLYICFLPSFGCDMHCVLCIYHFGMLQACCPTSLLPPMRRVALDSMQKNGLSATVQG